MCSAKRSDGIVPGFLLLGQAIFAINFSLGKRKALPAVWREAKMFKVGTTVYPNLKASPHTSLSSFLNPSVFPVLLCRFKRICILTGHYERELDSEADEGENSNSSRIKLH